MKIVIINGNPKSSVNNFDKYLDKLSMSLKKKGNEVVIINLKTMKLNYCIGCYACWLKTPGICIHKDDGPKILKQYINSDIVILSSPIIMGFISSILKTILERFLPVLHPFLYMHKDRMQHIPRYDNLPSRILLLDKSNNGDIEDIKITEDLFKNIKTRKFLFTKTTDTKPEELADEINNI
jgi:hypothetical protein